MSSPTRAVAEAFSSHRFADTYDSLAPDVRWTTVGGSTTDGKAAVIAVCEDTLAELAGTTTQFTRFVVAADDATAAVDTTSRYTQPDGQVSVVSSCDIYEFRGGVVTQITSYAVEETD
jgi:ketosteroid isomerase-like protein